MSRGWSWKSGDWYVSCDVCSRQIHASKSKKRWDGLIVCPEDFEHRHPQELIKVRPERQGVPFSRVEPEVQFVTVHYRYTLEDRITPIDSFSREIIYNYPLGDSLSVTDDAPEYRYTYVLQDSISVTEDFSYLWTAVPGFVDTITVVDSFAISQRVTRVLNGHTFNSQPLG